MKKTFNITGPCYPDEHYMLPAQARCTGLNQLIDQKQYFVIHAARQSGKTTLLLELAEQLETVGDYYVLYCSLETVQGITDVKEGIPAIISILNTRIKFHHRLNKFVFAEKVRHVNFNVALLEALTYFCNELDKPLVILFDEVDCLSNGTLISFLRQLRDGYINRRRIPFAQSIALVGMRNIRDYKSKIRDERETLGSASPFNIVKTSKTLRNFTQDEVTALYAQYTQKTAQPFSPDVIQSIYHYTQGQPWLVNAMACEIIEKILDFDVEKPILPEHVEQAAQTIILRRDTHIDSLMERLNETRVQKIIEPLILGNTQRYDLLDDDYQYVLDLGLVHEIDNNIAPSNPIYSEIIIRTLNFRSQREFEDIESLPKTAAYLVDDKLDMKRLLTDFQQFWRENSEIWTERYQYKETAPHLILQAFLQKIVNSGGRVSRELAGGRRRLDLCLHFQRHRYPIELKLRYSDKTYQEGKKQIASYMDTLGCSEGWLIVFDKRKKSTWHNKIFWKTDKTAEKTIHLVGC